MATPKRINRITLFKVPDEGNRKKMLDIYKEMPTKALKDGKPYILSARAGHAFPDQRAQGFTLAVVTQFASRADMAYYDDGCAAHKELKAFAKTVHEGVMMVYFEDALEE